MYDMLHSLLQLNDVHFVVSHVAHFVLSHVVCEMCLFNAMSYSEEITLKNQLISIFNQLIYCCITCFTLFCITCCISVVSHLAHLFASHPE